jgi:hypothetical protein
MQRKSATSVTKANGEREAFRPDKLYTSLVRSGAPKDIADRLTRTIADQLKEGDRTQDIYRRAFSELRKIERPIAARYSVKRALLELGPSGYPFEDFLAELYRLQGYQTSNRRLVPGRCVEHEMDLIATKGTRRMAAEVKFHNNGGLKSDIKVALYVQARFEDIKAAAASDGDHDFNTRMLITNTKFTEQAEVYAECVGLTLLSWDYPEQGNLRELIEETGIHPISCITTLSGAQKRKLMDQGVVLCRQLYEHVETLRTLGLSDRMIDTLFEEVEHLSQPSFSDTIEEN